VQKVANLPEKKALTYNYTMKYTKGRKIHHFAGDIAPPCFHHYGSTYKPKWIGHSFPDIFVLLNGITRVVGPSYM
jgi:hypothetical protein